ncbi:FAD-dependent monooxygenase [Brachybacterium sp. NBEC-018]|uniref:FAD-dependent monooxygenase n=1 Tax=Brachybacterium sp. NBEC-018 TaxID=2996004 RepID=UPI0021754A80|nr:FAD-dependent monooxygenase [Brachybacterium sp. NBEC-018]UVY85574.1 FAD-dependent monooxygenase [Brachybacterium sp. NBEC-018]
MSHDTEVLIAGAGPVGLVLALDLQRRGVSHRLVDAAEHGFEGSRAKGVQPRTQEVLEDLGVLEALARRGSAYPPMGIHLGPVTLTRAMGRTLQATASVPHPNPLLVPQHATDLSLRERYLGLGGSIEYGTRLTGHAQDADVVTATLETAEGTTEVRAAYLVGADGGRSTVRRGAGIPFTGTTDEADRMIVADVTVTGLSRDRWHIWPRTGGRFLGLCPLPDGRFQLMLKLRPEDPAELEREAVDALVHRYVNGSPFTLQEIHWASVWRPNIRLAEHYRSGRVLLAGDAAHVHPPTGGQGLNTGVQDAYNLGWKLGQVLRGAPEELLDTYEAERRPVAARVLGLSSAIYAQTKRRPLAATKRGEEERQLGITYRGGPLARSAEAGTPGLTTGDRAPDSPVTGADGERTRLFEILRGPQFTLLTLGQDAADLADPWPDGGAALQVLDLDPARNPELLRIYGIEAGAQVLVRPDGYVGGIARPDGRGVLDAATRRLLVPASA